jgi:2-polyprenyl-3-methyl-5-hydroxy-6-metoxy-1,4-benzoquinol methylase
MFNGLKTAIKSIEFRNHPYQITELIDLNEIPFLLESEEGFLDETSWPLFGKVWPSSLILAEHLLSLKLNPGKILEIGCGLGFPSLMLSEQGEDITASDGNPYTLKFLEINSTQNSLKMPKFLLIDWTRDQTKVKYDLIVGSDIIYERTHPLELALFLSETLSLEGQIILCDPNRSLFQKLKSSMAIDGFSCIQEEVKSSSGMGKDFKILTFART